MSKHLEEKLEPVDKGIVADCIVFFVVPFRLSMGSMPGAKDAKYPPS